MSEIFLQETNIISPLGFDTEQNFVAVRNGHTGIKSVAIHPNLTNNYIASIDGQALSEITHTLDFSKDTSRIEMMGMAALSTLLKGKRPSRSSLLMISTTKGNINALTVGDRCGSDIPKLAHGIADYFGFQRDPLVLSNACVSGLMALSVAKRYLQMGFFEDVYILAFDEVSAFVQSGFQSFQALSPEPCRPYDIDRKGVSLGEAAVACYISKTKNAHSIRIAGDSNINDANHISGPSRTGKGLYLSIFHALKEAGLEAREVDYIVGHGTATLYNDEMEAIVFNRAGLAEVPLASYKGNYGHTLGASGLLECALMAECMRRDYQLPSKGFEKLGTSQSIHVLKEGKRKETKVALKTASGFAGSNTALVLVKD